jgi:transposase
VARRRVTLTRQSTCGARSWRTTKFSDYAVSPKPAIYRYLRGYQAGGVEQLKALNCHCPESQLVEHKRTLEGYFREHPPATCAEAAARIEELTGVKRGPTRTREFLKKLGMKPRKVGQIPAKADVKGQETFKEGKLEPRLAQAKAGKRLVFFMDAAHFVYAPFLASLWCFERLFVKAPSGRQRLNVLAALNATTKELFTVQNLTSLTAETVGELLRLLAGAHPGMAITSVLDNARLTEVPPGAGTGSEAGHRVAISARLLAQSHSD